MSINIESLKGGFPFSEVRPSQERAMEKLSANFERGKRFSIFELPTGVGKCLDPLTPVMLFTGEVVPANAVFIGEQLMGPDSLPRTVIATSMGLDEMYEVTPTKGMVYRVNKEHILSLKTTQSRTTRKVSESTKGSIVNIKVADYLSKSNYFKWCAKGYRVGVNFQKQPNPPVDPYYVGLWLGDGTTRTPTEITSMDSEIVDYLRSLASLDRNPLFNAMKVLGLHSNSKFIPELLKFGSRNTRLELLAGYLDADGSKVSGGYESISSLPDLSDAIAFVARSLGFAAYVKPCKKSDQHGTEGQYYRVSISGDCSIIPVKLPRKRQEPRLQKKDVLVTGISVKATGVGPFYGFTLDGDGLFLLGDFTVTHNSGIAMASLSAASKLPTQEPHMSGGTILTSQKTLQQQYQNEFEHLGLADLRGASNYTCNEHDDATCDVGQKLGQMTGTICRLCPYRHARTQFISSPFGITNFSYFLTDSAFKKDETKKLPKRRLLIIDEAHNTEASIISHSEISLSALRLKEMMVELPKPVLQFSNIPRAKEWITKVIIPAAEAVLAKCRLEMTDPNRKRYELIGVVRKHTQYEQFIDSVNTFIDSDSELWFINQTANDINIKPLRGDVFAEKLLFSRAEHIIMMSATILDPRTFTRNLGIDTKECGYMSLPSEFPAANRRVIFAPSGSMSYKNYDTTLPKMLKRIEKILIKHENEKGIIHCNSFKLSQHIKEHFRGTQFSHRILDHDSKNRAKVVEYHLTNSQPTVLLSPSMTEGLDLKDELSRFQILAKCPWGNLGDPYIKARMGMDSEWYTWQACLSLVQSLGRSVRSSSDYATSYILDSDTRRLFESGLLPEWWLDAVEFK